MEEEIDLREYIKLLGKYWYWIIGASLIAVLGAFIYTGVTPDIYEAEAQVLIIEAKAQVSLEPKIRTEIDDIGGSRGYQQTLTNLGKNSDLAAIVLTESAKFLPEAEQDVLSLLAKISTSNTGDIIAIMAQDESPEIAAQLANSWAYAYEKYVNRLLNNEGGPLLDEVQNQIQAVAEDYRTAQMSLEQFISTNQAFALERQLQTKQSTLDSLVEAQKTLIERELASQENKIQLIEEQTNELENFTHIFD